MSIAWCPKIRKLQIRAKKSSAREEQSDEELYDDDNRFLFDSQKLRVKTARERMTAISSLVKLFLTPAVAVFYAEIFGLNINFSSLKTRFHIDSSPLFAMFIMQFVCSFFAQIFGWLACTIGLQKICFALPLILSTPVSIVLIAFNGCKTLKVCPCSFEFTNLKNPENIETIVLAAVMWLAQILSTVIYIWQSQQFLMAKEEFLFWLPSYDGMSLFSFILNPLKDKSRVDKIIVKKLPYQLPTSFHALMPPTVINWLMNLRDLGQISRHFVICTSVRRLDKEASNVNGIWYNMSTHVVASFRST